MINVLHVSRTMGQGGAEKIVFQLCKDEESITSYVASCGGAYVDELRKRGIRHILIPDLERKNPASILKTVTVLYKAIKYNKIEVFHSHHRMAAFYGRLLQIVKPQLKHIYTAHNVFYGKKSLMRFALSKATIIACGNTVKRNLINEYGVNERRIKVIFNSIEPQLDEIGFNENSLLKEGVLIGCIGRITRQKGFDIFIKAISMAITKNPNIRGVLIGDGEDREQIERLVDMLDIRQNIQFLGYRKDVISLISQLCFVVLPSRWEGFPLTPIEVFSAGKTIVCSDIENNLEIVRDGVNGLVFETENSDELADRILRLVDDSTLREKLEKQAFLDYQELYKYDLFIKKYSMVYISVVGHD